jgi:hypothetical protein
MMNFEIHITVESNEIKKFCEVCKEIGVKPILIETQNTNSFGVQLMTSSKHSSYTYHGALINISNSLENKGFKIIRKKVEIEPNKKF